MSAPAASGKRPKGPPENSLNPHVESHDGSQPANDSSNNRSLDVGASFGALEKVPSNQSNLSVPFNPRRNRSLSADTLSLFSNDDFRELRPVRSASFEAEDDDENDRDADKEDEESEETVSGWRGAIQRSWLHNKGLVWVILAQAFGVLMNVSTRLLENDENSMHPFQIIFVRMAFTSVLSLIYMYFTKTPDFPFGASNIRIILLIRGVSGFVGVFGIYWSLQYLPLADATVLTFMAPMIASAVCAKLLHERFGRIEQAACVISFVGVVLIAQPTTLFSSGSSETPDSSSDAQSYNSTSSSITARAHISESQVTSSQRLQAVGVAMLGVLGAATAYTSIRWIGKRAHPLISVNYFAVCATVVSAVCLAVIPSISFVLPSTPKQWALLALIGFGGFVMQFLLTAGLRYEKSSRPQNMVYSQMLFALAADKIIWDDTPGPWSWAGSALILGSAIAIAVQKSSVDKSDEAHPIQDEEARIRGSSRGRSPYGSFSEQGRESTEGMIVRDNGGSATPRLSNGSSSNR